MGRAGEWAGSAASRAGASLTGTATQHGRDFVLRTRNAVLLVVGVGAFSYGLGKGLPVAVAHWAASKGGDGGKDSKDG